MTIIYVHVIDNGIIVPERVSVGRKVAKTAGASAFFGLVFLPLAVTSIASGIASGEDREMRGVCRACGVALTGEHRFEVSVYDELEARSVELKDVAQRAVETPAIPAYDPNERHAAAQTLVKAQKDNRRFNKFVWGLVPALFFSSSTLYSVFHLSEVGLPLTLMVLGFALACGYVAWKFRPVSEGFSDELIAESQERRRMSEQRAQRRRNGGR